jgi:translation initiation factor 2 alpha subunit (eIF-2alpha)
MEKSMETTLEQRTEQIFEAIQMEHAETYGRDYRAFKHALEEAHQHLTLEDISELIEDADEEFAESHIFICDDCRDTVNLPVTPA